MTSRPVGQEGRCSLVVYFTASKVNFEIIKLLLYYTVTPAAYNLI